MNDCTTLVDPTNGNVALNGTSLGSVAQYSCNDNFMIVPENSTLRTCGVNNWDGVDPTCGMFVWMKCMYVCVYDVLYVC